MFSFKQLFSRRAGPGTERPLLFEFGSNLTFAWDDDCEGWVVPIDQLASGAQAYIGPVEYRHEPMTESCELVARAIGNIGQWNKAAVRCLVAELSRATDWSHRDQLSQESFSPTGLTIFEHEQTPEECSLTYDCEFDPEHIYSVRMRNGVPISWGMDG